MPRPLLHAALCCALGACALLEEEDPTRVPIPARWATCEPFAFERLLAEVAPGDEVVHYAGDDFRALTVALDAMDETSVRAALLFAHSRHRKAARQLRRRLEKRETAPTRGGDAGDVVAAAALPRFPDARRRYLEDLRDLAVGSDAHPDLEVRVECAASCLALGEDAPIPFLLKVLRIDTYSGRADERDFAVDERTAWARGRAAEALSARAGVPLTYQPDGSIAHREREAARLADLLFDAVPR